MYSFSSNEKFLSQIPALHELITLGYNYLTPSKALELRGGKSSNLLLEEVLREQLSTINSINYMGKNYNFSDANIQEAIQKLKNVNYDGLLKTNKFIYDLITLGTTLELNVEGRRRNYNFKYIDWKVPQNNVFHVVPEFEVEHLKSTNKSRPDIVLFVNGIPLVVIECKPPMVEIEKAISQNLRNQGENYIPHFFTFIQLIIGVNKNDAQYATVGATKKDWSVWNELEYKDESIKELINTPLSQQQKNELFSDVFTQEKDAFESQVRNSDRLMTEQDKTLYCLCKPERLIDLIYRFTLFDSGQKKIARYQQYFLVCSIMSRIKRRNRQGNRTGGIVWQTQGSGKSLSMVMLTRSLVLDSEISDPRIVLVTDRDDLEMQLGNTFSACGYTNERAISGRNLVKHLREKVGIITSLIHKFETGWTAEEYVDDSPDIFVLVDESHRTNYGSLATRMRQILPNSCYIGFTGTPLLKDEKNSFSKFGGLIEPHYSIKQAVKDKAVLPLLYEGRHVEMEQNQAAIDLWFERHTSDLNRSQKADLKKKYARAEMLNRADQVIYMRAFDVREHFRSNWQGTEFKAQLVAPSKVSALKYHEYFNELGQISSEVIISAPDDREGHENINEGPTDEVGKFWKKMMKKYGSEREYTHQIINKFKNVDEPEILIVVDKLLTGFDAPRNTVLYLCRPLREHTLLQAIARVNRLYEGKEFGYIVDYASVLGELDKALTMYDVFERFDESDLAETLTSINEIVSTLEQRHSELCNIFQGIKNFHDEEEFEVFLSDDERREEFYERLAIFSKTFGIALSTNKFIMETSENKLNLFKSDLKRFQNLKKSIKLRYAESIDYRDYEPKIKKLLDTHVQANDVFQLNQPVDIFNDKSFNAVIDGKGINANRSIASKADTIAHATKKVLQQKMDEDPTYYQKFSFLIQQAIDNFRAQRISDLEYLNKISEIRETVIAKRRDDVPAAIEDNDEACAFYGIIKSILSTIESDMKETILAEISLGIQRILDKHWKRDYWTDIIALNTTKNEIDDFFFEEVNEKFGLMLTEEQMDNICDKTMLIAKSRRNSL